MTEGFREILVTGASSPIGHALATLLRHDNPGAHIAGLSRRPAGAPFDSSMQADLGGAIPRIEGEFDLVVHAAAAVPGKTVVADEFHKVNVEGSAALFRALRLAKRCAVLNFSTSSAYDDPSAGEIDENSRKTSDNPYGQSKLEFEEFLRSQMLRPGLTILSVRIPVLLVAGVANNFVARWVESIRKGEAITLFNPAGLLNAVVDDAAIYQFAKEFFGRRSSGELTCNLSCRDSIPIRDAARIVMNAMGRTVEVVEKQAPKPAQTISHRLAERHAYQAPSTAECLQRFVERSLSLSQA